MEVQISLYIMTFLSYAWGFCDSTGWKINVNRQKCFSFHNDSQDFVTAQSLCVKAGGNLANLSTDSADILTMFSFLDTYFWTLDNNGTLLDEVSYTNDTNHKEYSGGIEGRTMKNCFLLRMVNTENITWHSARCDFKSKFLCERNEKSSPADLSIITRGGKYFVIMETRDYVAIAVGTGILTVFCVVVLVDIIKHIKRPLQNYKQMAV